MFPTIVENVARNHNVARSPPCVCRAGRDDGRLRGRRRCARSRFPRPPRCRGSQPAQRELARRYVPAARPRLDPIPVDQVRCAYNHRGWPAGDGFRVERRDAVTLLYGNNLWEFAPVLGALLGQAVRERAVPAGLSDHDTSPARR